MKQLKFTFFVFMGGYIAILLSLFRIQFLSANQEQGASYLRKTELPARRGVIYDVHGDMLAGSKDSYDLTIDPKHFNPQGKNLENVLRILEMPTASYEARMRNGSERWAKLAENVSAESYFALQALGLQGLYADQNPQRVYPEASLAATLIGFVGKNDASERVGYYGVEGYYEAELKGLSGLYAGERDLASRPILFGFQDRLENQDGRDLYLTIDKSVQQIVKSVAKRGMEIHSPKELCIIVADPNTMAILGLTCLPDYGPNAYGEFPERTYRNPLISDVYEPGSTFKPLVVAYALEHASVKAGDQMPEPGPKVVGDYQISTWNNQYNGSLSLADVLAKSSNVGMVEIGERMGNDRVFEMVQRFGFGMDTGIDLQGEVTAPLRKRSDWYPIDYATVTFGQGIAVTPIQLLTSFASVINGGELLKPYVVNRVSDGEKTNSNPEKTVIRRVVSESVSRVMRKMLEYTVEHAEYKWRKPAGYRFGGKTGTAQIALAGKYDVSKTIASFIGFTPVDKPRFIALVILKEPASSSWGSETAAPLFFDLSKELISYYNIPPEY